MGTFDMNKLKDTLSETAQDMKDRAAQVRDAVSDAAKETRDKAMGLADQAMASGQKVREMIVGSDGVLDLLKKDHEVVSGLFAQIEDLDGKAMDLKESLFAQLKYELSTHAIAEEKIFYTAIAQARAKGGGQEDAQERKDLIDEAFAEHGMVKQLLAELSVMQIGSAAWKAKLTVLKENVEHHVQEEENEIFAAAREALGEDRLKDLGVRFEREKISMAEAGKPDESDEPAIQSDDIPQKNGARSGRSRGTQRRAQPGSHHHRNH